MSHVSGIELTSITDPVRQALMGYQSWSEHSVQFDIDKASQLELTPYKPNAARSATTVHYLGEAIATLYVIAFRPGDGTGDESAYKLADLKTDIYPRNPKVVPRAKSVHTEAHLTLASFAVDQPNADPLLYTGNLAVIGISGITLVPLGEVGQLRAPFQNSRYKIENQRSTIIFSPRSAAGAARITRPPSTRIV